MKLTKNNWFFAFGMFLSAGTVTFLNGLMNYSNKDIAQLSLVYIGVASMCYLIYTLTPEV